MAYSAPSTRSASDLMSHTIWNQDVKDNIIAIHDPPSARVYHSTTQSVGTGAGNVLAFNSEDFDTATLHDTATNNSRLTAPIAGVYLVTCYLEMTSVTSAKYELQLRKNGGTTPIAFDEETLTNIYLTLTTLAKLSATDYLEMFIVHGAGTSQTATANCWFGMTWLGAGT